MTIRLALAIAVGVAIFATAAAFSLTVQIADGEFGVLAEGLLDPKV